MHFFVNKKRRKSCRKKRFDFVVVNNHKIVEKTAMKIRATTDNSAEHGFSFRRVTVQYWRPFSVPARTAGHTALLRPAHTTATRHNHSSYAATPRIWAGRAYPTGACLFLAVWTLRDRFGEQSAAYRYRNLIARIKDGLFSKSYVTWWNFIASRLRNVRYSLCYIIGQIKMDQKCAWYPKASTMVRDKWSEEWNEDNDDYV